MKICLLIPSLSGGGAEFVTTQWAGYLRDQGHSVEVYVTHAKPTDLAPAGVEYVVGPRKGFFGSLLAFRKHLALSPPDCIVALMPFWNLMAILAARFHVRGSRPAVLISGRNAAVALTSVFGLGYRVKQWMARHLYRYADGFIAISHPIAAEAVAYYALAPSKVTVVPNPALAKVEELYGTASLSYARSFLKRADSSEHINIVVPARLVAQKRPHIAVMAADWLKKHHGLDCTVHYFGTGPLQQEVANLARELQIDTKFHGWVKHWFTSCPSDSVVVLASLAEGFGNVLVEAAAMGIPSVVSSRCLGAADAVIPGVTGTLIHGESYREFAEGIIACRDIRPDGIDLWLRRFSRHGSGEALLAMIDQVVSANRLDDK